MSETMTASDILEVAKSYLTNGYPREAEQVCRSLHRLQPDHFGANFLLGVLCFGSGRLGEATDFFKAAVNQNPDATDAVLGLGRVLLKDGDVEGAKACFEKALRLAPDQSAIHIGIGDIHLAQGRPDKAVENFVAAVRQAATLDQDTFLAAMRRLIEMDRRREADELCRYAPAELGPSGLRVLPLSDVKSWCARTGSPYRRIEKEKTVEIPPPNHLGRAFPVDGGVLRQNELYIAEIPGATIFGKQDVVATGDALLLDAAFDPLATDLTTKNVDRILTRSGGTVLTSTTASATRHARRGLFLCGMKSDCFGHFYIELMPKLALSLRFPEYDHVPIFVDADMPASHYEAVRLMAGTDREIVLVERDSSVTLDTLLVAPTFAFCPPFLDFEIGSDLLYDHRYNQLTTDGVRAILDCLADNPEIPAPSRTDRKIFVSRRGFQRRSMINEEEVTEHLVRKGFEVVQPESLSYAEQIGLMRSAAVVTGPNGSYLATTIFCRPGCRVVPFFGSNIGNHAGWAALMTALGIEPLMVCGSSKSARMHYRDQADYFVPLDLVDEAFP